MELGPVVDPCLPFEDLDNLVVPVDPLEFSGGAVPETRDQVLVRRLCDLDGPRHRIPLLDPGGIDRLGLEVGSRDLEGVDPVHGPPSLPRNTQTRGLVRPPSICGGEWRAAISLGPLHSTSELVKRARRIASEVAAKHAGDVDTKARFPHEAVNAHEAGAPALRGRAEGVRRRGRRHARASAMLRRARAGLRRSPAWCSRCTSSRSRASRATAQSSPYFQTYLREIVEQPDARSPRSPPRSACGATRAPASARVENEGGKCKLEKDATTVSYGAHADDLLVTVPPQRRTRRRATRSSCCPQGRVHAHADDAPGTRWACAARAARASSSTRHGRRGPGRAGLVRRRLGADDGPVLAHPLGGALARASRPTRSRARAASSAPRRARSRAPSRRRRHRLAEVHGRAPDDAQQRARRRRVEFDGIMTPPDGMDELARRSAGRSR